eukprot:m.14859 g.14859  ORF g.14859 m.14859 type:complete len:746 (-) comp6443_c0_seq2:188-2425(-)
MTSIVRIMPLSGALSDGPPCQLLELDGVRILLDCGWTESFDVSLLEPLAKVAPTINAVLLSHPDIQHIGALPYAFAKLGLECPVYATEPVKQLGHLVMYDAFQARHQQEDFETFTLNDIDAVFDSVIALTYSQTAHMRDVGIKITAYAAGHTIGGSLWHIELGGEEIVFATDYNHRSERHLSSTALRTLSRPAVLITDAFNYLTRVPKRKDVVASLTKEIEATVRRNGNVLLLSNAGGRFLEVLLVLDRLRESKSKSVLSECTFALIGSEAQTMLDAVKTRLEYMSDDLVGPIQDSGQFTKVQVVSSMQQLDDLPGPKVVLVCHTGLEMGFARRLFVEWASSETNSVIFTDRPDSDTLGHKVLNGKIQRFETQFCQRVLLQGHERDAYFAAKEAEEQRRKQVEEEDQLDLDEDSTEAQQAEKDEQGKHDLTKRAKRAPQSAAFAKARKRTHLMFPFKDSFETGTFDDYGQVIDLDHFREKSVAGTTQQANAMDTTEEKEEVEVPTKIVSSPIKVEICAPIQFLDLEGRTDGEGMRRIVADVKPAKVVLVHGSEQATMEFAENLRSSTDLQLDGLEAPSVGTFVNISSQRNIYQVKLRDELVSQLAFRTAGEGEYQVAWMDASVSSQQQQLPSSPKASSSTDDGNEVDATSNAAPAATPVPSLPQLVQTTAPHPHDTVFIGDLRLSTLRELLKKQFNYSCEFRGGDLVVQDAVAVHKDASGVCVDGPVCEVYFNVRKVVYSQYAMV